MQITQIFLQMKKISLIGIFALFVQTGHLFSMTQLYFESEDSLVVKVLVLLIGMALGILITAKIIYPQLLEHEMNPFKARNIFNATIYSIFVLLYGITFHATIDILYLSIALGVAMIIWMLIAIIKN
ncbi:MAG: hypothetical protein MUF15_08685 [Acidobacteria bacterium]|nr:hypothetical protein [Acidobacteriota bacterium]